MKLGDVVRKERERAGLSPQEVATLLALSDEDYGSLEAGVSSAEDWGPRLALLAIELETPVSRLISETGRAGDAKKGSVGSLIREQRLRRGKTSEEVAQHLGLPFETYVAIERGESGIEEGAYLLRFAEAVGLPMFNLFYPCGLPLEVLADY